jgi:hypothetical protein
MPAGDFKLTLQLYKIYKRRKGVSRTSAGCGSAICTKGPEQVMYKITKGYVCDFRDQDKSCRHIWAFYACPSSPLCNVRLTVPDALE